MYIANTIAFVILLALYSVIRFFSKTYLGEYLETFDIIFIAALVLILAYCIAGPIVFYRHYGYIITPEKVDVRKGILVIRRTLVPLERVHQVEVRMGPINNMLGLADVELTTAGGVATIQFLEREDANRIAEELNLLINNMVKDRKKDD